MRKQEPGRLLTRGGAAVVAVVGLLVPLAPAAHAADVAPPDTTISAPTSGQVVSAPVSVQGGATDDVAVASVGVAVRDTTTGLWWTGSGWQATLRWNPAVLVAPGTPATNWSYRFAPTAKTGDFLVTARAKDAAGNIDTTRPVVRFSLGDRGVPRFQGTLAGPGLADLTPVDVAATASRYYVLDVARYRIVAVDRATGAIVAQVGGSRGSDSGELGAGRSIAVDSAGNVYFADTPNARITKYDADLGLVTQWGSLGTGPGQFTQVYGVAIGQGLGPAGTLTEIVYAVDGSGRIQRFTPGGAFIGSFASTTVLNQPRMAAVNPATNDLWVVNARARQVVVFDVNGTERFRFGSEGTGAGQFTGDPRGIAITADGTRVFVSDEGNHRIQVFSATGVYLASISAPAGQPDHLLDARGLDVASGGILVVTDQWDYALKEWTLSGAFQRRLFGRPAPVGGVNSPRGLAVDPGGRVFVSDWWNQRIQRFDADGSNPLAWGFRGTTAEPGSINFAWDVVVQPGTGRVFVANRESHEIEVFTSAGAFVTRWGTRGTTAGKFTFPHGVAFDPTNGTLLVTDSGNGRVQRFTVDAAGRGTLVEVYGGKGTAAGQFDTPTGVDVASDGTVWVADTRNNRIQKRDPSTGAWTAYRQPVGRSGFAVPWGVSVAPDGRIWVADTGNARIVKADRNMSPDFVADGVSMGAGALNAPFEIEFGAAGRVYLSDTFNNRVIVLRE